MKRYTEQDLRLAFQAGIDMGKHIQSGNYYDKPLDEDEYIESLYFEIEESTIGFTYEYLKLKLDWLDICKITGLNEYCRSEGYEIKDSEVFNIKESIAQQFNLI